MMLCLGAFFSPLNEDRAKATERIAIQFGFVGRSIPVSSLAAFAEDGTIDQSLRWYLRGVNPEVQEELRKALTASREINPSEFSQLLHTPEGDVMLRYTGQFIQTNSRDNGARAIRGALVVAASQPEGISLLSFLQAFPTPALRLDLGLILTHYRQVRRTIADIDSFLSSVKETSQADAAKSSLSLNLESISPLGEMGPYAVSMKPLILQDQTRDRTFPVDLYRPEDLNAVQGELSVLVLSHGLGGSRDLFADFGEHLASHGFVVAIPQHIGSDRNQQLAVRRWLKHELFQVSEFVDRPRDISFLLDELERINATEFTGKLNLSKVGVLGHSFGGTTALTLAGATVDFDRVNQLCRLGTTIDVGLALLLTCRIRELQDSPESIQLLSDGELRMNEFP
ncbi:MAG: alpha/beta fold hydrolase [Synechococcaceae cyanobacterium SM2_3_1]|nr:alpha/beta fold hydrolase [Synechococcaceae cyanobacterium SM2_3_1]